MARFYRAPSAADCHCDKCESLRSYHTYSDTELSWRQPQQEKPYAVRVRSVNEAAMSVVARMKSRLGDDELRKIDDVESVSLREVGCGMPMTLSRAIVNHWLREMGGRGLAYDTHDTHETVEMAADPSMVSISDAIEFARPGRWRRAT